MKFSPIVLFTYNRPIHTKKVLDALAENDEAKFSHLYIYCDGPKPEDDTLNLAKLKDVVNLVKSEQRFKKVSVFVRNKNEGLANSIVNGVTQIIEKYEKIIVLEDDIVVSVGFLKYMNDALNFYENHSKVMHISGYMYPNQKKFPETFFFNVPLCWGWATWKRAWDSFNPNAIELWSEINKKELWYRLDKFGSNYLSRQLAGNISGALNTWFIKWHASVMLEDGYTLYPKGSLVDNIGFDNSGVHNGETSQFRNDILITNINVTNIDLKESELAIQTIQDFYCRLRKHTEKKSIIKRLKEKVYRKTRFFLFKIKKYGFVADSITNIRSYIGFNCKIYSDVLLYNSVIGNYTYISQNSSIKNTIVGKFCSIGPNLVSGWGTHPLNGVSTHPMFYSLKKQNGITLTNKTKVNESATIQIGNDVFIGMNVTILDGVKIGNGAVIGAGSVVSKDIPAYSIVAGNPIKVLRYRFNDDVIRKLEELRWWDFSHEDLYLVEKYFFDIDGFMTSSDIARKKTGTDNIINNYG